MASTSASSNTARARFAFMRPPVLARACDFGVGFVRIWLPCGGCLQIASEHHSWPIRERECEGRALPDLARHPDLAPVQLDKLPRQRKAETGAFVPARTIAAH